MIGSAIERVAHSRDHRVPRRLAKQARRMSRLLVVAPILAIAGCGEPEITDKPVRPVRSIVVGDSEQMSGRRFPGIARAAQEVNVSFRVSGPLVQLPASVGDEVSEGQLLAQIDPRDYEVSLRNVKGQLQRALAARTRAESDAARVQRIMDQDPGATSQRTLDAAIEQRDEARASVSSLEASVAAAEDQLSYASLRAPFAGTVVATFVENFEDVRPNQPVVRVVNDNRIEMVVDVPEGLISLVPSAQEIHVQFDALGEIEIPATISEIGTEASPTTRTYPVTLVMDQPPETKILSGMAGKAFSKRPADPTVEGGLEVPLSAVLTEDGTKTFVWVIDPASMTVEKRSVATGQLTDFGIRVSEGISPGDRIVTAGVSYLADGQEVRLFETES